MPRIAVLGSGLVGATVASDLAKSFQVTAVDLDEGRLARHFLGTDVECRCADLSNPESIGNLVRPFDLVLSALPGHLGHSTLRAVLEAGVDCVDLAFSPEDPFDLDELARSRQASAVVDMGLAPGMSNAILGHHVSSLREVERFDCQVGGLPVERCWPFEYKAPFSPADVLEEYTRPARLVENGVRLTRPALSQPELVEVECIGTLEAFNTDGLRTLLHSYAIPWMRERTLRYPGHANIMGILAKSGFFDTEPVELKGGRIRPRDLTSKLLFDHWNLAPGEPEFTFMRVVVAGVNQAGEEEVHRWEILDRTDPATGDSSMARTTGFACAAAAHLLLQGRIPAAGIVTPEKLGEDDVCFDFLLSYQRQRGIHYQHTLI